MSKWYKIDDYAWINDGDGDYVDVLNKEEITKYNLTLSVSPENCGTISGDGEYEANSSVTISATANDGYKFESWNNGVTDNPYTFEITTDVTLIANFKSTSCTLTTNVSPENSGSVVGGDTYTKGDKVTLTAIPNSNYKFVSWSDGSTNNPYTFTINEDLNLTANFEENKYSVSCSISPSTAATISGTDLSSTFNNGDTINLSVTTNQGYSFKNWTITKLSDDSVTTISTTSLSLVIDNSDYNIVANFDTIKYKVTLSTNDNTMGYCTQSGNGEYMSGTIVTVTAHANSGYDFESWSNGETNQEFQFVISGDIDLVATFKKSTETFEVYVSILPIGSGTVSGSGTYTKGSEVTLTANANEDYQFSAWTIGDSTYAISPYTFTINENTSVIASFVKTGSICEIDVSSSDTTMGTASGGGTYSVGTQVTLTAYPNEGYEFVRWSDGTTSNPYRFNVTKELDLVANFRLQPTSQDIFKLNSNSVNIGSNLSGTLTLFNKDYTYKFFYSNSLYWDGEQEWKTIKQNSSSFSFNISNEFEEIIPNSSSLIVTLICRVYGSNNNELYYQTNTNVTINVPDSFKPKTTFSGLETGNLFDGNLIAGYSTYKFNILTELDAPSGYTNHASITSTDFSSRYGRFTYKDEVCSGICNTSSSDYTLTINSTLIDSRTRTSIDTITIGEVKGYTTPLPNNVVTSRCDKDGNEDLEGTYAKVTFNVSCEKIGTNGVEKITCSIDDGKTLITPLLEDSTYTAILGNGELENKKDYVITIYLLDSILKSFDAKEIVYKTSLLSYIPISLYDDTEGNVGVSFGKEASIPKVDIQLDTNFGSNRDIDASAYEDGELLSESMGAYQLLKKTRISVSHEESKGGEDASKIMCMTGEEWKTLDNVDNSTLYFLTSVPDGES